MVPKGYDIETIIVILLFTNTITPTIATIATITIIEINTFLFILTTLFIFYPNHDN